MVVRASKESFPSNLLEQIVSESIILDQDIHFHSILCRFILLSLLYM